MEQKDEQQYKNSIKISLFYSVHKKYVERAIEMDYDKLTRKQYDGVSLRIIDKIG